jgi:hypothetical protein
MQTTQTLCHKQRKRDNANNASVIMANRRHHKLAHTVSIIQDGTSKHHLAREGRHHKPSGTSKHHKLEGVSLHHLAAARVSITYPPARVSITHNCAQVSITNPGAQFFILKAANPPMIKGLYGKQFFIPRTISIAYSIRDAYGSVLNDKFCLYEYKCTSENENHSQ